MAFTEQDSGAPGMLHSPDPLLHRVITETISDTMTDPSVVMPFLGRLMSYERNDIERYMNIIDGGHEGLRDYLGYTFNYLNRDQFARYVDRVENYYADLMSIPDMHTHEAWELLVGYHERDPGQTVEQTRAVLMVNATVLEVLLSYRYFPLETVRHVIVHVGYTSDGNIADTTHDWSLKELAPELIDFVTTRVDDLDRILGLIRSEYLWHPDYLALRLDGSLPASGDETEAQEIRRVMLGVIDVLPLSAYSAEDLRDCRVRVEEAFDNHDLDSLRVYRAHRQEFLSNGYLADRIIRALRTAGHDDTAPIITSRHFDTCRTIDKVMEEDPTTSRDALRVPIRTLVLNNLDDLERITSNMEEIGNIIRLHGVSIWSDISELYDARQAVTPILHDGIL